MLAFTGSVEIQASESPGYKRRGVVKSSGAPETGAWGRRSKERRDSTTRPEPRTPGVSGGAGGEGRAGLPGRAVTGGVPIPYPPAPRRRGANSGGDAGMPGVGLTSARPGQARADRLALKPYWGKPTVRNFRGGGGDVGIIRSPVRATALPDKFERSHRSAMASGPPAGPFEIPEELPNVRTPERPNALRTNA